MTLEWLLLLPAGGVPLYMLLEKRRTSRSIFLLSALLLLGAIVLVTLRPVAGSMALVAVSLLSAFFTFYKALQTTNFYRLGYLLIGLNAPAFFLFAPHGVLYSLTLLAALLGLFMVGGYYERHYGSANYHNVSGITLETPCIGTFLTLYLIALALYPPFPNALFFLAGLIHGTPGPLWYVTVTFLFAGNFVLAMRVMTRTLFGRPNPGIHYVHMTMKEKMTHGFVVLLLLVLTLFGLKETLS